MQARVTMIPIPVMLFKSKDDVDGDTPFFWLGALYVPLIVLS